jgi:hypothetical protein
MIQKMKQLLLSALAETGVPALASDVGKGSTPPIARASASSYNAQA